MSLLKRVADLVGGRRNWRETSSDWRSRGLVIVDAGGFDHPSYLPIKALEDALEATGLPRISNSSALERIWSRAIIRFDLTRFYVRLTRRTNFIVIMNLPARRFYPQGWWSETIVYCFDCWSGRYDEWELFLQRNRIRIAFFSARDAACELSRRLPGHTIAWMPEAIDAAAYSPARPLVERSIDLLEFGRSWPRYHQQIGPHCKGRGYAHRFPADGKLLFPTQEELHRGLADAKLVVCVPQSVSHPEIAGSTETMSLRYLEVIASGAIPLGRCPKEMHDLFGYNPVIEIDEADPEGQLDRLLARIDELAGLRERNLETLLRVATWECRAHDIVEAIGANDIRATIYGIASTTSLARARGAIEKGLA